MSDCRVPMPVYPKPEKVFACAIELDELEHTLTVFIDPFHARRLVGMAIEIAQTWPGSTAADILKAMIDDAASGMSAEELIEKYEKEVERWSY